MTSQMPSVPFFPSVLVERGTPPKNKLKKRGAHLCLVLGQATGQAPARCCPWTWDASGQAMLSPKTRGLGRWVLEVSGF